MYDAVCVCVCTCVSAATGKSTFLRILQESTPSYHVVSEPLTRWQNVEANQVCMCVCVWCVSVCVCECVCVSVCECVCVCVCVCRSPAPSSVVVICWICSTKTPRDGPTPSR